MINVFESVAGLARVGYSFPAGVLSKVGQAVHVLNGQKTLMGMYRFAQVIISGAHLKQAIQSNNGEIAPLNNKLVKSLSATGTHFAFEILNIPSKIFTPFSSKQVDEKATFDKFVDYLCTYYGAKDEDDNPIAQKTCITENEALELFNQTMKDLSGISFWSAKTFNREFIRKVDSAMLTVTDKKNLGVSESELGTATRVIEQKTTTPVSKVVNRVIHSIDIVGPVLSTLSFLQEHNCLDTAKIAGKLGQYRGFQWLPKQTLSHWILGLYTLSFGLQTIHAVYNKVAVTQEGADKKRNSNVLAGSVANFVNLGALLYNAVKKHNTLNSNAINIISCLTHSFGLWNMYQFGQIKNDEVLVKEELKGRFTNTQQV